MADIEAKIMPGVLHWQSPRRVPARAAPPPRPARRRARGERARRRNALATSTPSAPPPRSFFAWYPANTSFPAILGDMMIGAGALRMPIALQLRPGMAPQAPGRRRARARPRAQARCP